MNSPATHLRPFLSLFLLLLFTQADLHGQEMEAEAGAKASLERLANDFQRHFLRAGQEHHHRALGHEGSFTPLPETMLGHRVMQVKVVEAGPGKYSGTIKTQLILGTHEPLTTKPQRDITYKFLWRDGRWHVVSGTYAKDGKTKNAFREPVSSPHQNGTPYYEKALQEWAQMDAERMQKPEAVAAVARSAEIRANAVAATTCREMFLTLAENMTAEELADLVIGFTLESEPLFKSVLMENAARAAPSLTRILKGPEIHAGPQSRDHISNESLIVMGQVLGRAPDGEAIKALAALWPVLDLNRRRGLLQALVVTGAAEAIPAVEQALSPDDKAKGEDVWAVANGLRLAHSSGKKPGAMEQAIAKHLPALEDLPSVEHSIGELLVQADPDAAVKKLLDLSPDNPADAKKLHRLLPAVSAAGLKLPRERLLALMVDREFIPYALPLLGQHAHPGDKAVLEFWLKDDQDLRKRDGAVRGLARWHGLPEFDSTQFIQHDTEEPPAKLSAEVRAFVLADYTVNYFTKGGDLFDITHDGPVSIRSGGVAALQAVGLKDMAALLKKGMAVDAANVVSRSNRKENTLSKMGEDLKSWAGSANVALLHYRLKHLEVFKDPAAAVNR